MKLRQNKITINNILPILLVLPIILSYFESQQLFKLFNTLILPFVAVWLAKKYIRINILVLALVLNALIGLLIVPVYDNYMHNDYLHIVSYLTLLLGAYYFSISLIHNIDSSLFRNLIISYFTIVIFHHLFVYIGIGEGNYFWDVNFITQRKIENAVFSNIGNGKYMTILLTVFALISTWFCRIKLYNKILLNIILISFGILSFSRALIIVVIISFIIFELYRILILKKIKDYYLLAPIIILGIILFINNYDLIYLYVLREDFTDLESISRIQQLEQYLVLIGDHIYFGTGWTDLDTILGSYLTHGKAELGGLMFIVEQGMFRGGILLVIMILSIASMFVINYKKLPKRLIPILLISFVSILVGMVWGNNIVADIRSFIFWMAIFNFINVFINYNIFNIHSMNENYRNLKMLLLQNEFHQK
ncbi:MAG: hypothetical protein WD059_04930 [Balneolaceae bacterium]